ncbi:MAG: hypothetical protein HYV65_01885 [Candidatus Spechtbacteria bacterium]|nr:hypothetical protein [Candidatus Spechtbacteria bacterium]
MDFRQAFGWCPPRDEGDMFALRASVRRTLTVSWGTFVVLNGGVERWWQELGAKDYIVGPEDMDRLERLVRGAESARSRFYGGLAAARAAGLL